jgi:hypothetical protein
MEDSPRCRLMARAHVDARRRGLPRDYVVPPQSFGIDPSARFVMAPWGDDPSLRVARLLHSLVVAWRSKPGLSGAAAARRWGISKQTWSRTILGERWPGETMFIALVTELHTDQVRESSGSSS